MKNKRYEPNKKNGGIVPECQDKRLLGVETECGWCEECRKKKMNGWRFRLQEQMKWGDQRIGLFVTLSYSEEALEELEKEFKTNDAETIGIKSSRRFFERYRKEYKTMCKHWCVMELGHKNTERLHIHGILFVKDTKRAEELRNGKLEKIWGYGNIYIGDRCNEETVNYVGKYLLKVDTGHKGFTPRILCSPGLGKTYIEREWDKHTIKPEGTIEYIQYSNGAKGSMPRYYRRKRWTDEEREFLTIQRLNKNEGYIGGVKYFNFNSVETQKILQEYREFKKAEGDAKGFPRGWERKKYKTRLTSEWENKIKTKYEDEFNASIRTRKWSERKRYSERVPKKERRNTIADIQHIPQNKYAGTNVFPAFQTGFTSNLDTKRFNNNERTHRSRNENKSGNYSRRLRLYRNNTRENDAIIFHKLDEKKNQDAIKLYIMLNKKPFIDTGNGLHCPF